MGHVNEPIQLGFGNLDTGRLLVTNLLHRDTTTEQHGCVIPFC